MVIQRPGFLRANTDKASITAGPSDTKDHELKELDGKTGAYVQAGEVDAAVPPQYDGEDVQEGTTVVETAGELVTQVIHVEDDPDMQAITFRTMFLGK